MRGGLEWQSAHVLIREHDSHENRQRCSAAGCYMLTLTKLDLNYSSASHAENAKHTFEYLPPFVCY